MAKQNKDLRKLLNQLEAAGFLVEKSKRSAHYKITHPDKPGFVSISSSSSDSHALKNAKGDLRRVFDYGR